MKLLPTDESEVAAEERRQRIDRIGDTLAVVVCLSAALAILGGLVAALLW